MTWFRRHLGQGTRLALMALAIQFVASFGHFHPIELNASALPSLTQAAASGSLPSDLSFVATTTAAATDQQKPPAHHGSDPNDICSICAVMALASTALFATPPVLLLPQASELLYLTTDAAFVHLESFRVAFQPRAPPAS